MQFKFLFTYSDINYIIWAISQYINEHQSEKITKVLRKYYENTTFK